MVKVALKIVVGVIRLASLPLRGLTRRNKVVCISRQSNAIPDDFRLLGKELAEKYPQAETVFLCRKLEKSIGSVIGYMFHMGRQLHHIFTAKVVILDSYCICASVVDHPENTKIIQLWHAATAIKKFGYQTIGKYGGHNEDVARIMCMHKNYDYVIAPSDFTKEAFSQGFHVDKSKCISMAQPHFQEVANTDCEKLAAMKEAYHIKDDKKIIVYVPTFRKGKTLPLEELSRQIDRSQYHFVARLHPLDQTESADENILCPKDFTTIDWMKLADILILDYSSLIVEGAVLRKPMYFYQYDKEDYEKDPGVNVDMAAETLGQYVFKDAKTLETLLQQPYNKEKLAAFAKKYMDVPYNHAAKHLADFVVSLMV